MADITARRLDALTDLSRHLVDALRALVNDEGSKGLKNSNAARMMAPSLSQAEMILQELTRMR